MENKFILLVGKEHGYICLLRGEKREVLRLKTMWIPYNLPLLEETLRNKQYLRIKGINTFEEEGKNIMKRLISEDKATLPVDINYS